MDKKGALEKAWYVLDKDVSHNILIVGQGHDHPQLYASRLICSQLELGIWQ